ncbi:FKBP-type peptidyl-prolyl cis-trans isomerase [Pseudoxanthomonas winnipegensis]|jgi:FKBP-type peptidyl-prolyl cis-trans isomerase FkpA|uniref:Peptidyl-prolyl cis-trans isomerase n=1 Tax=Pseudoxanthomonas winnipegensis TaxID=2480810 RepID=A0A4Q8M1U2_9GAMM|nr:FKBP-type peptidyl-prolyl cis-trans isomerase [Pseudoxanthomonas winnipegensis]TAA12380.1 FKBP-type peptidyl-prolyl cis-trans isomerase [Pseudoxanthomonas winnipegensis]TAA19255.1 FKBP-type peptidyl-prolyl cis-trans isomerase [Pseudoxanthomonas winnipegensis]TAA38482.1 FKBP-type peptidyl-prolyl cis-trans isomerase [Pseudoxanthomonas winnipegensis]TAH70515.1 FKBP-type peptidyl-prolyl cis-trans isomerase [Pseudoxanthomonas winnipegensis]
MRRWIPLALTLALAACAPPRQPIELHGGVDTLQVHEISVGQGAQAKPGDNVSVHYTGWIYDDTKPDKHGPKFDSSIDRGTPFTFPLGGGQVIKGWDQGVAGMKVGGKRTLMIPAALGYGDEGAGGVIPPGASLVFDVELLDVKAP